MRPAPASLLCIFLCLLVSLSTAPAQGDPEGDADGMADANRAAGVLLLERMRRDRPQDYACLKRVRRSDILVVNGQYDHVDQVLTELGTPFASTSTAGLARTSLEGVRAVIVNCPGRIGRSNAMRLC